LRRKQLSLVLAGKLNPQDATELKALFFCKTFFFLKNFILKSKFTSKKSILQALKFNTKGSDKEIITL
jgi:hypothetical protein